MKNNSDFLIEDKSGRGYKSFLDKDDLLCRDNDEDWNDQLLHDFAEESEIGDVWQDRTVRIIRVAKTNRPEVTLSADETDQLMDAIWVNIKPFIAPTGLLSEDAPLGVKALYEAYTLVVVRTNWVPK